MIRRTAALALLALIPVAAGAQTRPISGRVITTQTRDPIRSVLVSVVGTSIVTTTGDDGRFTIVAPTGDDSLLFRRIGYKRRQVLVAAGQDTVQVAMEQDVFVLDAVVVTGQATGIGRQNATTATTVVSGADITQMPAQTVDKALQGKVPGAIISQNSGAPGGGVQIQMRGVNTVLGNPDPLFVVDGVIYSNASVPSGLSTVTSSGSNRGSGQLQDDPVNRLADLNPNDIETIEVLRGAAASSIYGSKAANGVLVIHTKRGQVGKPLATITQRLGFSELLRGYGTRAFTVAEADSVFGVGAVAPYIVNGSLPVYDHMKELAGNHPMNYQTALDVSGGTENTRYMLSGSIQQDNGIIQNTGAGRQTLRVNLDQTFSDRLKLSFSSAFNRTQTDRGFTNNDNNGASVTYSIAYIPGFEPLLPVNGAYPQPGITYKSSNPLQTTALATNEEVAQGFTGSAVLTFQAVTTDRHRVQLVAGGGLDVFNQSNSVIAPPELYFEQALSNPGTATLSNAYNRFWNWNLNAIDAFTPASGVFHLTSSAGIQLENRGLDRNRVSAFGLLPGQTNVDQGNVIGNVLQDRTLERTLAFYAQEELLARDERLDVTGGLRAERSSANGATDHYFIYPKLSASYRFPNLLGAESDFKVRAAYGETGNQPVFGQKFTDLLGGQVYSKHVATTVDVTAGAPDIRPERIREIEGGFDATLPGNRGTIEVTGYRRHTTDLLLSRTPPPSSGFSTEIINGGELMNEGIEIGFGYTPIQRQEMTWVTRVNFNTGRNEVVSLPFPGFRPPNAGFGRAFGEFFLQPGKPTTQIIGQVGIDGLGNFIIGSMGQANPDFVVSFPNDFRYKRVTLSFLLVWQKGGEAQNQTLSLYDCNQLSVDQATPAGQQRVQDCFTGIATPFVQSTTFLRMQDASISYDVPESWLGAFGGASSVRMSLAAHNLFLITKYTGYDPQVSNYGEQAVVRNIDLGPYPPSRSFTFTISAGF